MDKADCEMANWERDSLEDDDEEHAQVIRRMYAELTAARIAQSLGVLIMLALVIRYAFTSGRIGAIFDTLVAGK